MRNGLITHFFFVGNDIAMMTYPALVEGKVHLRIHIPECLAEVWWTFPKSAANTPSPSEKKYSTTCRL